MAAIHVRALSVADPAFHTGHGSPVSGVTSHCRDETTDVSCAGRVPRVGQFIFVVGRKGNEYLGGCAPSCGCGVGGAGGADAFTTSLSSLSEANLSTTALSALMVQGPPTCALLSDGGELFEDERFRSVGWVTIDEH